MGGGVKCKKRKKKAELLHTLPKALLWSVQFVVENHESDKQRGVKKDRAYQQV